MKIDLYLKQPFKQNELIAMGLMLDKRFLDTPAHKGICQELCWKWLKRLSSKAATYDSPKKRMDAFWKEQTLLKAMSRHNTAANNVLIYPHTTYTLNNVQCNFSYRRDIQSRWRIKGGGLYFSFRCPNYNNEKHSIAAYIFRQSGQRLLDPLVLGPVHTNFDRMCAYGNHESTIQNY
ncbi:hypothetical protein FKG94_24235 [Exilibacterium tricleocarpae]|uniref:Uncharacterized protein n=1 Tax=Exilibacterium tricleocarpae TaxID=2591008 RepID=A0A545ST21_9GAMM|nr:hypothetical protein [Exilibacterium tricleocarpae]TQV68085.1 hypothetical protein FKG94_24235 [Exilibacterium tricleocarpae]